MMSGGVLGLVGTTIRIGRDGKDWASASGVAAAKLNANSANAEMRGG
jgi:hypothetical protein